MARRVSTARTRAAAVRRAVPAECSACGSELSRRATGFAAGAALVGASSEEARAYVVPIQGGKIRILDSVCFDCAGRGLVECNTCVGTGVYAISGETQWKMYSNNTITCPECQGYGKLPCNKCLTTGLPEYKLKGLLRDPAFAKFQARMRIKDIDIDTVKQVQAEVKEALKQQDANKQLKKQLEQEEAAKGFQLPSLPSFPGLPSF